MDCQRITEQEHTPLWNLHPNTILRESILVCIEPLQRVSIVVVRVVHGGILLVSKDNAIARHAFALCLLALSASWSLLIAFELPMATRETMNTGLVSLCNGYSGPRRR